MKHNFLFVLLSFSTAVLNAAIAYTYHKLYRDEGDRDALSLRRIFVFLTLCWVASAIIRLFAM